MIMKSNTYFGMTELLTVTSPTHPLRVNQIPRVPGGVNIGQLEVCFTGKELVIVPSLQFTSLSSLHRLDKLNSNINRHVVQDFYQHNLTLISVWISNHKPCKMWDEIIITEIYSQT